MHKEYDGGGKNKFVAGAWSDELTGSVVRTYVSVCMRDMKAENSEFSLFENPSDSRDLWAGRTVVTGTFGSLLQPHQTNR